MKTTTRSLTTATFLFLAAACPKAMGMAPWFDEIRKFESQVGSFLKNLELASMGTLKSIRLDEDSKRLEFEFSFAGFDITEINASITEDKVLKISAEKKVSEEKTEESDSGVTKYIFKSRESKIKAFRLDLREIDTKEFDVDLGKTIESTYKNGILKISIPLKKKTESERKLSIKSEEDSTFDSK
ncbi:MAG: hypothetical protein US49_C0002G0109 [candidate division TM6 bacterium GW2011_GWF2_37_49]|nr:MAG: hypothetical protein US49_C0002G0109 [candidate division TM6 bacterium GW2011_GWF2_37_49]